MHGQVVRAIAVLSVVTAVVGCREAAQPADELRIASPHRDEIKYEFERAFQADYRKATGRDVQVVWLDLGGGTSAIFRYLNEYSDDPGASEVDVVFGGGMDRFVRMAGKGFFQPYRLPKPILDKLRADLHGVHLYDPKFRWYGATLSTFGIVYNKVICRLEHLPEPRLWNDLAAPRLAGWVMCGDPRFSGVVHMLSEITLQTHGWRDGWKIVLLTAANARGFTRGSGEILRDVNTGEAAVGGCIDFYALSLAGREGADKIGYAAPEGQTPISPDSIAIVRAARHRAAAEAFVRFVMSEAGQRLWIQRPGTAGGPHQYALGRHTLMPHLYADRAADLTAPTNPFAMKSYMIYDTRRGGRRWTAFNDLYGSTIIQAHDALVDAWRAVIRAGRPPQLLDALTAAPCTEEELNAYAKTRKHVRRRVRQMERWLTEARRRYHDVARQARDWARTHAPGEKRGT